MSSDLIKNNKKSSNNGVGRGGRGRGSSGPGPSRRFPQNRGGGNRITPYSLGKPVQAPDLAWQHEERSHFFKQISYISSFL
ncbi:hypothetical protein ACHQM5_001682 [Ranunculus cassubicifolius]